MKNHVPIYVISLSRTPERRLYIKRQLDSLGLQGHFVDVDAIDKYKLDSKAYRSQIADLLEIDQSILENKYAMIGSTTGLTKGQLAITLSHIKIYDLMVKKHHSEACILEDDATLLPTFPEVLKVASERSWDILQLAHRPGTDNVWQMVKSCIYRRQFHKEDKIDILSSFLQCWIRSHDDVDEQVVKFYGFDNQLYPQQSKYIMKVIKEFRSNYRKHLAFVIPQFIIATIMLNTNWRRIMRDYSVFTVYTQIQLGARFKKDSLQAITNYHCIAEPSELFLSATAYMVRQSAAAKWKQRVLSSDIYAIDKIPWQLHQDGQAKLCLVSPPCVVATQNYLKYSSL